ncbi:MAG: aspartate-semialdehyde dehydrogenase [Candidatus Sumerlaeia bacterium]|nr:aspartate-semialdehyde dehydrogenase [Candidatus Sumerlaeia bacterium]
MVRTAILGATGAVGQEMIKVVEERNFPVSSMRLLASPRSQGRKLPFRGRLIEVQPVGEDSFKDIDLVLSSAGASVSKQWLPKAVAAGATCVDNTSAFRMEPHIPLVVPEVNPHALENHPGIISNPNCSTIQMVVALNPIQKEVGIKRLVISTYQAVSGKSGKAILELLKQVKQIQNGEADAIVPSEFPYQIAYNCLPHIDVFLENGYTREEMKMVNETRKIYGDPSIAITATTVRVPVIRGHSESINVETRKPITIERIRELLSNAPGVALVDDVSRNEYPMPIYAAGRDLTYVGRIRKDESIENGFNIWVVSDNLRKGAALNAVQIAEVLLQKNWLKARAC